MKRLLLTKTSEDCTDYEREAYCTGCVFENAHIGGCERLLIDGKTCRDMNQRQWQVYEME
jgi:hypothetical protein